VAFKVNYGLERAERNRAKQAKKEAKAKAKKAGSASGEDQESGDVTQAVETDEEPSV